MAKKQNPATDEQHSRQSHYNANRHNYMTYNGAYVYEYWDEATGQYKKQVLTPGQNAITEDLVVFLDGIDHEEDLQERYERENSDYRMDKYEDYMRGELAGMMCANPLDKLAYNRYFRSEYVRDDALTDKISEIVRKLNPEQVDLVYQLFGAMKQMQEVADEEHTTKQAIYSRRKKILTRLKKFLQEIGIG